MEKPILFRMLKVGSLPKNIHQTVKNEGILVSDEGCKISVTYHKFKTKGKYFSYKRTYAIGSIAVTSKRTIAFAFSKRIMNFQHEQPGLEVLLESPTTLLFIIDVSKTMPNSSGEIEIRYFTENARTIFKKIK